MRGPFAPEKRIHEIGSKAQREVPRGWGGGSGTTKRSCVDRSHVVDCCCMLFLCEIDIAKGVETWRLRQHAGSEMMACADDSFELRRRC